MSEALRPVKKDWLLLSAFAACFMYWAYLMLTTQMLVQFDAITYQELGQMIYQQGWGEYFRTGPHREPLYPALIAASMFLGDTFHLSYIIFQKVFQVLLLFLAQVGALFILRKLAVPRFLQALAILYVGFSPALNNAAFSLFSEISVFPFVPACVWLGVLGFRSILAGDIRKACFLAGFTAFLFFVAALGKAIFLYMFFLYILPAAGLIVGSLFQRQWKRMSAGLVYLGIGVCVLLAGAHGWKSLNQKYNGHYALADNRGSALFFGNAYKRTLPLTKESFGPHLLSIPGQGVCEKVYSSQACFEASFFGADYFRHITLKEKIRDMPESEHEQYAMQWAKRLILQHPLRYGLYSVTESFKMFFWESTQVGNVEYSAGLKSFYQNGIVRNGLRLVMSVLSCFGFFIILFYFLSRVRLLFDASGEGLKTQLYFFVILMIFCYTAIYAMFTIVVRYTLPMAPLFLICIAGAAQSILDRKKGKSNEV